MANPNPIQARISKAEKKREVLTWMLSKLENAVETADELLNHEDPHIRLRAVHAISQVATSYAKVYEVGELEARLQIIIDMYASNGISNN